MEVLVFAGGDALDTRWHEMLPAKAFVVAADSGLEHVHALGLHADLVVGDFDSVHPDALERARGAGSEVHEHPADKDATDLELALRAAQRRRPERVTVVGAGGGRLDHFLANALLLAHPDWADFELRAFVGPAYVHVVRRSVVLTGPVGSLVSLLPVGGPARGVRTAGLRWPLTDEDLRPGSTRGVSNELAVETASVTLREGVLLAVQPDALQPPAIPGGT
jgi:thiamine pyrophosphokinase